MKVWTSLSEADLFGIADKVGVALSDQGTRVRTLSMDGRAYRFGLRPTEYRDENGDHIYQRVSTSAFRSERRVYAVCWHGYRDFMRAIFEQDPEARIKTYVADYRGVQDFEDKYSDTYYTNVGSMMYPAYMGEACKC